MSTLFLSGISRRSFYTRPIAVVALLVLPVICLDADVPAVLQNVPSAICYCHCHEAITHRGCTKMCDAKRHGVQWLAKSCMKPRFQPPADKSGTGPHFRHPDRAEHAQLTN
jgi:hypothetical protein